MRGNFLFDKAVSKKKSMSKERKELIVSFVAAIVLGYILTTIFHSHNDYKAKEKTPLHFATLCDPYVHISRSYVSRAQRNATHTNRYSSSNDTYLTRLIGSIHYWHPNSIVTVYIATESEIPERWSDWNEVNFVRASPVSRDPTSDRHTEIRGSRAEIYRTFPSGATIFVDSRVYLNAPISSKSLASLKTRGSIFVDKTQIRNEDVASGSCTPSLEMFGVVKESDAYEALGSVLNECIRGVCRPETLLLQDDDKTCEMLDLVLNNDAFAMHSRYCVFAESSIKENHLDCMWCSSARISLLFSFICSCDSLVLLTQPPYCIPHSQLECYGNTSLEHRYIFKTSGVDISCCTERFQS